MKRVTLFIVTALIAGTLGFLIKVPTAPTRPRLGPAGWVHLQKLILPLFENVCEESTDLIIVRLSQEFDIDSTTAVFERPEVKTNWKNLIAKGFLPKGQIFTDYNVDHLDQLKAVYDVFVFAKDFDTFLKAAAWARQNINCGLFVRAIYLAVLHRRDTEKLTVPAPYELLPHYFIQKDVIVKASALLSGEEFVPSETVRVEGNSYVLDSNYTANFVDNDAESKLAYFHEDVGLNTYYFLLKLKRSPWFNASPDMSIRYGEYLYHMMKNLAARYNLERYANGFSEVGHIDLEALTATPYDPMVVYSNGKEFGYRTTSIQFSNLKNIEMLKTIESNIATVLVHMRDAGYNKTQILNHLMELLVTSERSFETLLRSSVGKDEIFDQSQPSVLEHYLTTLRDPIFWKLNQKIVDLVDDALQQLPAYTRNELYFPGVEVLNIDIKKMTTSFDLFQLDVTNALQTDAASTAFQVKIGQPRLNHKPFVIKLNVSSLVAQKGQVKIFLGPKVAPGELAMKRNLFMLLDSFEWNLKIGSNVISRSSEQMLNLSEDFTTLKTLSKNVEDAEFGLNSLPMTDIESLLGFPNRLILPKGTQEGLPLQLFVIVAPFAKTSVTGMLSIPIAEFNSATLSPGYPLDLPVDDVQLLNLPNIFVKDVMITHKGDKVANFGGSGSSNKFPKKYNEYNPDSKNEYNPVPHANYDPASRPSYLINKASFDYSAKKEQYGRKEGSFGKKDNYASKGEYYKSKDSTTVTIATNDKDESAYDDNPAKIELDKNHVYVENKESNLNKLGLMEELVKDVIATEVNPTRIRKPTVYDYIVSTDDYDEYDNRVYE